MNRASRPHALHLHPARVLCSLHSHSAEQEVHHGAASGVPKCHPEWCHPLAALKHRGNGAKTAVLKVRYSLVTKRLHRWRVLRRPGSKPPGAERLLPTAFHSDQQGPEATVVMWACIWLGVRIVCVLVCLVIAGWLRTKQTEKSLSLGLSSTA